MKLVGSLVMILLISAVVSGCGKGGGDKEKLYDIKGKVVAVDTEKKKVTLDHEEIPGLMNAMEMSFDVGSAKILEGIKPGDKVQGKLKVDSANNRVITQLLKQ
jgi:protein SCO1/2